MFCNILLSPVGSCDFYVNVQMTDRQAVVMYGAPDTMWLRYTVRPSIAAKSGTLYFISAHDKFNKLFCEFFGFSRWCLKLFL